MSPMNKSIFKVLFALSLIFALASGVSAQNGADASKMMPPVASDFNQLPYSILVPVQPPAGWTTNSTMWLTAIWDRNASGAWYRNPHHPNIGRSEPFISYSARSAAVPKVSCTKEANFRFKCRDLIRNLERWYECPSQINWSVNPKQWRSRLPLWPFTNEGWFHWDANTSSRWFLHQDARWWMPRRSHYVLDGYRLDCGYQIHNPVDIWLQRR